MSKQTNEGRSTRPVEGYWYRPCAWYADPGDPDGGYKVTGTATARIADVWVTDPVCGSNVPGDWRAVHVLAAECFIERQPFESWERIDEANDA